MATYAVGDIQGCLKPLKCLLKSAKFNPKEDTLWVAGDLINRGPSCLATLRFLYDMRDNVQCVLGNHDLHLLAIAYKQRKPNKSDTLSKIIKAPDRDQLLNWLRQQPLVYHDKKLGYTMVHAGIPPQWSIDKSLKLSAEVSEALQGKHFRKYLANMYGNTPDLWDKTLTGTTRLRVITNYFTRMRFCSADGKLELTNKGSAKNPPENFAPWFTHKKRKAKDDKIVFGHWAALEGDVKTDNVYALDTGCVWGEH